MGHDRVLWIFQWIFGLYFIAIGIMHFIVPEGLPELFSWMYDLSDSLHIISGTAEILGGLGLIVPGLVRIRPELTSLAAVGLIIVMVGAIVWHVGREEFASIGGNVVTTLVLSYIAYSRWRLVPFSHRSRINTL